MTWTPNSATAELNAGINHQVNPGHANLGSITLDGALQRSGGVQQVAADPHAVLNTAMGGSSNDTAFEQYQRTQGGYAPGSMPGMEDQIEQGSDNE